MLLCKLVSCLFRSLYFLCVCFLRRLPCFSHYTFRTTKSHNRTQVQAARQSVSQILGRQASYQSSISINIDLLWYSVQIFMPFSEIPISYTNLCGFCCCSLIQQMWSYWIVQIAIDERSFGNESFKSNWSFVKLYNSFSFPSHRWLFNNVQTVFRRSVDNVRLNNISSFLSNRENKTMFLRFLTRNE